MRYWLLFYFLLVAALFSAQEQMADSVQYAHFDCGIIQTKQKLDKLFLASAPTIHLRVNNDELLYTTFQLGKRKNNIYLYLKILANNICIKKDKNVDIYFKSGEIITLSNEYPLNCEALFARQLNKKEIRKIKENEIVLIKIYTYKKNYEMYINDIQNQDIHHYLDCLSEYKIKKSDAVKVKNKK